MKKMKVKLKPCPFCGFDQLYNGISRYGGYCVRCLRCNANIEIALPSEKREALEAFEDRCLKEVVRVWNRRANEKNK